MTTEMQAGRAGVDAADGIAAAAALTVLVGFFAIVNGFAGIIKSTYIVNAIVVGDPVPWGILILVVGVLQLLVAYPMGQPRRWALAGGTLLAIANGVLTANVLGGADGWAILLLIADAAALVLIVLFARRAVEELTAVPEASEAPAVSGRPAP
jgi:hypothetical protein